MLRTHVKTYRQRIGKNHYIIINIFQSAEAKAESGNVLASNAVNVQICKSRKKGVKILPGNLRGALKSNLFIMKRTVPFGNTEKERSSLFRSRSHTGCRSMLCVKAIHSRAANDR